MMVCYKVWIELEANYFTLGKSIELQPKILEKAARSALPIATFNGAIPEWGIYKHLPSAMEKCQTEFPEFCDTLESQVEWVRALIAKSGDKTLYEALFWLHEEFEMEMMFGPI